MTPPPPQKGYLSDTCAIPLENKANGCDTPLCDIQVRKNSLNIKILGRIFLGHQGPKRRDIPDKNFMQVACFSCFIKDREWPGCPGI